MRVEWKVEILNQILITFLIIYLVLFHIDLYDLNSYFAISRMSNHFIARINSIYLTKNYYYL
jgi:hypothetical protein